MSRMPDEDAIAHEFHRSGNLDDGSMDYRPVTRKHNGGPPLDDEEPEGRPDDGLEGMDLNAIMQRARRAAIINLTRLVEAGQATPADMSVLRALLKDNGMVMGDPFTPTKESNQGEPGEEDGPLPLPEFGTPEHLA